MYLNTIKKSKGVNTIFVDKVKPSFAFKTRDVLFNKYNIKFKDEEILGFKENYENKYFNSWTNTYRKIEKKIEKDKFFQIRKILKNNNEILERLKK